MRSTNKKAGQACIFASINLWLTLGQRKTELLKIFGAVIMPDTSHKINRKSSWRASQELNPQQVQGCKWLNLFEMLPFEKRALRYPVCPGMPSNMASRCSASHQDTNAKAKTAMI